MKSAYSIIRSHNIICVIINRSRNWCVCQAVILCFEKSSYLHTQQIIVYTNDYRRGLDCWVDSLASYTHDLELQIITAPPPISTIHKSPQHPLSSLHPVVSSPAVPWQQLLTVEFLRLHAIRSSLTTPRRELNWTLSLAYNISPRTT
jgi:hypothetical protein